MRKLRLDLRILSSAVERQAHNLEVVRCETHRMPEWMCGCVNSIKLAHPWLSWLKRLPVKEKTGGSNPPGCVSR